VDPTGVWIRSEGGLGRFICGVSPDVENDPDCDISGRDWGASLLQCADYSLFEEVVWPALYERIPAFEELKVTGSWAGFYDYNTVDQVRSNIFWWSV
jgi:glycine/D-amino acid oxidase-like deaminating enzyme